MGLISYGQKINTQNFNSLCMGHQDHNSKEIQLRKIFELESCRYIKMEHI
jgi:hypothetical protein